MEMDGRDQPRPNKANRIRHEMESRRVYMMDANNHPFSSPYSPFAYPSSSSSELFPWRPNPPPSFSVLVVSHWWLVFVLRLLWFCVRGSLRFGDFQALILNFGSRRVDSVERIGNMAEGVRLGMDMYRWTLPISEALSDNTSVAKLRARVTMRVESPLLNSSCLHASRQSSIMIHIWAWTVTHLTSRTWRSRISYLAAFLGYIIDDETLDPFFGQSVVSLFLQCFEW